MPDSLIEAPISLFPEFQRLNMQKPKNQIWSLQYLFKLIYNVMYRGGSSVDFPDPDQSGENGGAYSPANPNPTKNPDLAAKFLEILISKKWKTSFRASADISARYFVATSTYRLMHFCLTCSLGKKELTLLLTILGNIWESKEPSPPDQ